MIDLPLTEAQQSVASQALDERIFIEGPAGAGKTTAGVARLRRLLEAGVPGDQVLLLAPQRTMAEPYYQALHQVELAQGGVVSVLTAGGLAQRMVELFWPLAAEAAGFGFPDRLPTFLTLETAQYYMAHLVRPHLEDENLFDSVVIDRNRLYSQILDNLNKAAVVGFPYTEVGGRLKAAWAGEPGQLRVYDDVQTCASRFREFCLKYNLLDFSLQVEVFRQYLWPEPACWEYLWDTYRHLICENIEEDTPFAHNLLAEWLPQCDSALLIYDWGAGYRRFLGADPDGAYDLRQFCTRTFTFQESLVAEAPVQSLAFHLSTFLRQPSLTGVEFPLPESRAAEANPHQVLFFEHQRFYPQMLDWTVEQIAALVDGGTLPSEIVVLAPFLSDALRFSLSSRLEARGIAARSHRPSRSLREEPVTQCLLTLSALAHPEWGIVPARFDVAYALVQAIDGLDLVRAQLLSEIVYRRTSAAPQPVLTSFDQINPEMQERITYRLGERYERLRLWLAAEVQTAPEARPAFDHFISRLFGEVLSQPGFGFHALYSAGEITANLMESVRKFRWVAGEMLQGEGQPLGAEYLGMVQDGVIAAQYMRSWQTQVEEAVLLAPAYTFLMSNRPVDYQFWLDPGSRGWVERLYQPLTHPYVLSRAWPEGRTWSDADEVYTSRDALQRLALGLLRRCRRGLFLGLSELGEQGYEQRGLLLQGFQRVLREQP